MRIIKCDLCRKKVKGSPIIAGTGYLETVELCEKCGLPIIKFLKKNKCFEKKRNKINIKI